MDLSKLSDADLMALQAGDLSRVSDAGLSVMSGSTAPEPVDSRPPVMKAMQDLVLGGLRGAGSIGATLLTPYDMAAGNTQSIGNPERRQAMTDATQSLGADPSSLMYQGGKLAGEVAGTAGAGGAVANGLGKVLPSAATPFLTALQSAGMNAGGVTGVPGLALRTAGGAVSGGLSAGIVNPDDAGMGAMIGGAVPGGTLLAAKAGDLAKRGVAGLTKNALGMTTGAGAETFSTAYKAGKEGSTTFLDNMRGNVPMTDVLDSAKQALSQMRLDRGAAYRGGMVDIANDKAVIDFAPIDKAVNSLKQMGSFKGQVINKNAAGTVDEVAGIVNKWKALDPAEYHTPEGLDALKKAIGDIRDATQFGTPGRKAADTAYNAVKAQIEAQAPTYAKVMRDYSKASESLSEIERALSLGNKASADTSMRKLQSLMRNNVNTNYGNRLGLAQTLETNGADILPAVAGQAASSWTPRGLQGLAASGAGVASLVNPATLAALPFTSPRLMGEAAYGLGALRRGVSSAPSLGAMPPSGLLSSPNNYGGLLEGLYRTAPVMAAQ